VSSVFFRRKGGFFFGLQSKIYNLRSLSSASLCDLGGESFLMSRRCGAASPYRGIEEVMPAVL
jgi:hypothetical protein